MKSLILSIDGMTCSACSNGLEKYLNKQNGIFNSSVNLVMANATITYDENTIYYFYNFSNYSNVHCHGAYGRFANY